MPDHFRTQPKDPMVPRSPSSYSDSPLALVIGKHNRDQAMPHSPNHPKSAHEGGGSPGRSSGYSDHIGSPDRSTHEDLMETSNIHHEEVIAEHDEEADQTQALSLVVEKSERNRLDTAHSGDSGHEDDYSGGSSPIQSAATPPRLDSFAADVILKRKLEAERQLDSVARVEIHPNVTIAKVANDNLDDEDEVEDLRLEEKKHPAAAALKIKDFARFSPTADDDVTKGEREDKASSRQSLHIDADDLSMDDGHSDISSADTWNTDLSGRRQQIGGEIVFPCDFCDKIFSNKYHLQSHLVTHTGERNFSCRKCGKCFGRKSTLRAHMTTHTKTSNFMCPLCEKACNDNNSLEEHIRMHTGEKPFVCSICCKAYARKSHLNVHYRVHTGERPFVCVDCGKDFTEKRFLNDHMQTAHSGQDGPLKCPNCFREFAYKTSLKQHLKKQMCAKNINRGQTTTSHGVHAKQFQCPFCEKSYSWKQTLKQHVSMYHRNKVHTDEFWKYELAKHRRVGLDNAANEDLWRKQLGRHANEENQSNNGEPIADRRSSAASAAASHPEDARPHEERWLDQIQRASQPRNSEDRAQVAAEMKLLALQSLHLMNICKSGDFEPPKNDNYMTLLAQIRSKAVSPGAKEQEQSSSTRVHDLTASVKSPQSPQLANPKSPCRSPGLPPSLPDIKEESAAKRTQMWLAQLGQYRHRSLIQEELDRNHEELWEEQIARVKAHPIKSPLEPVEIVLDDEKARHQALVNELKAAVPIPPKTAPAMVPLMSALQLHPPPSNNLAPKPKPAATITKPPSESDHQETTMPKPNYPEIIIACKEEQKEKKPMRLPLESNIPELVVDEPALPTDNETESNEKVTEKEEKEKAPTSDSSSLSFLKSILMDRSGRKRPSIDPPAAPSPPKAFHPWEKGEDDILRRRLLGMKDPIPPPTPAAKPKQSSGLNTHLLVPPAPTNQQHLTKPRVTNLVSKPPMSSLPETPVIPKAQPQELTTKKASNDEGESLKQHDEKESKKLALYSQKSVLKHLLYRYTEQDSQEKGTKNETAST